ncbi:hypoxanthine phosphoribosyltransferase, putative [Ichthyophthirius multifiliis]|uniref:Hypoxanthine phosphoribosyltransferase, putative n=1 Tax=Ichthyophthirius multifiliis TaxID=5932 RepID=G0QJM8_ICHMU|nr:hypoxanthine phosphoribosyltransferase, putative [Ichthyophthirius multifiliis]EGR34578.1 hypoxanthine phosphoribosyltransferase, putative [Ichthyophthirius multifiliis]|eukprot:XP_004039882.1 hypoxanthine phosphoribosyltransferase, putative [Ichthyophthirius multifiliis]
MDIEFCKVSSYVGTGTTSAQTVQKLIGLTNNIKDRHVVIVEDTIDSGFTLDYLIKDLQKEKPKSISLCAMFLKKANLQVELDIKYIGMTIDPEFVIGYGLDYDEWGRNIYGLWINK